MCTCGIVVAEVFQGLRRDEGREAIRRSFEDLTFLEPAGIRVYLRAAELRKKGTTIRSTVDCIIASVTEAGACAALESPLVWALNAAKGWSPQSASCPPTGMRSLQRICERTGIWMRRFRVRFEDQKTLAEVAEAAAAMR